MPYQNTLPAAGMLTTSLTPLFTNLSGVPAEIRLIKLVNNSCADRQVNIFLNSNGFRTPILPEKFQLKTGCIAQDEAVIQLRKDDAIDGFCDGEQSVTYIIS
jgi:hypothetical protein